MRKPAEIDDQRIDRLAVLADESPMVPILRLSDRDVGARGRRRSAPSSDNGGRDGSRHPWKSSRWASWPWSGCRPRRSGSCRPVGVRRSAWPYRAPACGSQRSADGRTPHHRLVVGQLHGGAVEASWWFRARGARCCRGGDPLQVVVVRRRSSRRCQKRLPTPMMTANQPSGDGGSVICHSRSASLAGREWWEADQLAGEPVGVDVLAAWSAGRPGCSWCRTCAMAPVRQLCTNR